MLGRSTGPAVSVAGLGCNNFGQRLDVPQSRSVIEAALDEGVTFFDTADVYASGESERILGKVLAPRRHDVILATKFGYAKPAAGGGSASRANVMVSVNASLNRLNTDYIDLYQLHRPDADTPWEETLLALHELVRTGKVRFIGASNLTAPQIAEARQIAGILGLTSFITQQNEYSLLRRSAETDALAAADREKTGFLPFFPLANGMLSGKYRLGKPPPENARLSTPGKWQTLYRGDEDLAVTAKLRSFAEQHGHTLLELAFSWLLSHDGVSSVIAGATTAAQVRENAAACGWILGVDELKQIDDITGRPAQA